MTTIVLTEDEVAWDTQYNLGNIRVHSPSLPKVIVKGGKIFAYAGDSSAGEMLPEWVRLGADPEACPPNEWECAVISLHRGKPRMRVYTREKDGDEWHLSSTWMTFPHALGTGGDFALGALKLGVVRKIKVTAAQAAYVGSLVDINSGGEIQSLNIPETLQKAARKRKVTT